MKLHPYQKGDYLSRKCLVALFLQQISASTVEPVIWSMLPFFGCFSGVCTEIECDPVRNGLSPLFLTPGLAADKAEV